MIAMIIMGFHNKKEKKNQSERLNLNDILFFTVLL